MTILEGNSNDKDNLRAYMVKGEKGDPGVSPTFETRRTARGGIIEITDVEGTEELELYDGESYEIPTNGVIGWASEDTIPGGYEEINCGNSSKAKSNLILAVGKNQVYHYEILQERGTGYGSASGRCGAGDRGRQQGGK